MSSHVSKTYCLFWKVISIRMLFFFLLYGHQPQWRLRYTFKSSLLGFVSRRNYSKLRFPGVNFIIFSLASFALILRWSYKVTTYLERKKKNTKVGRNFYLFVMVELCINKLVKLTSGDKMLTFKEHFLRKWNVQQHFLSHSLCLFYHKMLVKLTPWDTKLHCMLFFEKLVSSCSFLQLYWNNQNMMFLFLLKL